MNKPTTQDVLDHLMEHYDDLSVMSKQLLGLARQVLVTHDALLEITGAPFELGISRERLREHIANEEDLPVEVGALGQIRERRNINVGPCPANWPNGVGMGNGQHVVDCYDLDENVKVRCLDCEQDFYSE